MAEASSCFIGTVRRSTTAAEAGTEHRAARREVERLSEVGLGRALEDSKDLAWNSK